MTPGNHTQVILCGAITLLIGLRMAAAAEPTEGREYLDARLKAGVADILKAMPEGTLHEHTMVAMRDGVRLATDIFRPPATQPVAAVVMRTPYGRLNTAGYAARLNKGPYAFVVQDLRGVGQSEGKDTFDPRFSENDIADGYDCIEWIAAQPWCNKRVGMLGGSGHGQAAAMAYIAKPPHLVVVQPSAGNTHLYWSFENGARRWLFNWLVHRGLKTESWPRPTTVEYDLARWRALCDEAARDNTCVYLGQGGWFDIFLDSPLDTFERFAAGGKVFITVNATDHGGKGAILDRQFPSPRRTAPAENAPAFLDVLAGKPVAAKSRLRYYVMGDVMDERAPGNEMRVTSVWPIPGTPTPFYFTGDGGLSREKPPAGPALSYRYDPRDPAPTIGGHHFYGKPNGALDQRPLAGRKDVLRFVSPALEEPLSVIGRLQAELHFSTDVPDTMLVVKLVDIYPNGAEALVRESAALARSHAGSGKPAPLEKGRTYRLAFSMSSTALIFNKGHRIGILVTSSSDPAYEVHPNTFDPVGSIDKANIAITSIHVGGPAASCIILPVTQP